jgi:hypothetical protein
MNEIDWNRVFEETIQRRPGLSDDQIATFVSSVQQPLTTAEFELRGVGKNVRRWKMPEGPLPESYLSFLRWSDGGEFRNCDRLLQFFPALDPIHGVRIMTLVYLVPERSPGLLPFAFDGGGIFYAFDMRMRPDHGEYNIVAAECGYPHTPGFLASTFLEACQSRQSLEDVWSNNRDALVELCPHCCEELVCSKCGKQIRD